MALWCLMRGEIIFIRSSNNYLIILAGNICMSQWTGTKWQYLKMILCTAAVHFVLWVLRKHADIKLWNAIQDTEAVGLTLHVVVMVSATFLQIHTLNTEVQRQLCMIYIWRTCRCKAMKSFSYYIYQSKTAEQKISPDNQREIKCIHITYSN